MVLDFSKFSGESVADSALEPRRIFAALPEKHEKYTYPRDVQSEVWDQWARRRSERDLVIKMNTGGGKTVVGLLILKSCLNEKCGPAVYLTPDRYLAEQVRIEAGMLGLEVTEDPRSPRFQSGKSILVVNVKTLVNGLSKFGLEGSSQRIPIGSLLIDDAHAAIATVQDQFTLQIPHTHEAYDQLIGIFDAELRQRSPNALLDILDGDWRAVLAIPFWSWSSNVDHVLRILHPHREDEDFLFKWPLIHDCIKICRVAVTSRALEIAPPCPAIDRIPSLVEARRKIYLTATLPDDSTLVTHFGADPTTVARPITPSTAADLGDRMILTPLDTHPMADGPDIIEFLVKQAKRHNVIVIVPSTRQANLWRPHANLVLDKESIYQGVEQLRNGSHLGLVVLVNKYDGIDLPQNACRILAIDGLPESLGGLDRLDGLALGETDAVTTRQIQRIEQGIGRGVRSADDHCVVFLLGAKLTQRLRSSEAFEQFSPATKAQLRLSERVADELHGRPLSELESVVDQCLNRDPGWINASRRVLDGISYQQNGSVAKVAHAQRRAFDQASVGQYRAAADILQEAADDLANNRAKGWVLQQVAAYRHLDDPVAAQHVLAAALKRNRNVLKPRTGSGYGRLTPSTDQAAECAKYLADQYSTTEHLLVGFNAILDDLRPHPDTTPEFEEAWANLGQHLGFATQRPERDRGNGPDVLWALGDLKFLIVECKSGTTTASAIARKHVEQLTHSVDWFLENYDASCTPIPLLIHKESRLRNDATARQGSQVLTFAALDRLARSVRDFAVSISSNGHYRDAQKVSQRLVALNLTGSQILSKWCVDIR